MKLVRCPNQHFYDGDTFSVCPHCSGEISQSRTAAPVGASSGSPSVMPHSVQPLNVTQPLHENVVSQPPVIPQSIQPSLPPSIQQSLPPSIQQSWTPSIQPAPPPAPQAAPVSPLASAVSASVQYSLPNEIQKTVGFYDFGGTEPVVGWLVCVKGEHHGQSFQLKSGQNIIGRDLKMDVALTKDGSVSRNRHSVIMFDPKNAKFYIQQGESGLTYLDGELVLAPMPIKPRALVGIGNGEYIFVPLCGDGFSWDDYKQ